MKPLPKEIVSNAFVAANGEYAWQRSHIFEALRAIAGTGQATLGGEVWAVKDGKIWGMIPDAKGGTDIWAWDTLPYKANERWSDYCNRTCDESIRAIERMKVEDDTDKEFQSYIFFNLTYIEQNETDLINRLINDPF